MSKESAKKAGAVKGARTREDDTEGHARIKGPKAARGPRAREDDTEGHVRIR